MIPEVQIVRDVISYRKNRINSKQKRLSVLEDTKVFLLLQAPKTFSQTSNACRKPKVEPLISKNCHGNRCRIVAHPSKDSVFRKQCCFMASGQMALKVLFFVAAGKLSGSVYKKIQNNNAL